MSEARNHLSPSMWVADEQQKIVLNIFHRCVAVRASRRNSTISNKKVVIKGSIVTSKARVINRIRTITYIIKGTTR